MYDTLTQTITLQSGYDMPVVGLGTWGLHGSDCEQVMTDAIDLGYRSIDTAESYGNESDIGKVINRYAREDLFITSKVSSEHLAPANILAACQASLKRLQTDYLDLYLIHWPNDTIDLKETMIAMNELIQQGWVHSIGVSNFNTHHLDDAMAASDKPVCVNQIEYHAHRHRERLPAFCADHHIVITAYSPLARGEVLSDPVLQDIAHIHGRSAAQVSIKWLLQQGCVVIPKAARSEHLRENADLDGWALSDQEMERINAITVETRVWDKAYT